MSFQVGIGSLGGTVLFQVWLCTPLRTMRMADLFEKKFESNSFHYTRAKNEYQNFSFKHYLLYGT